MSTRKLTTLGLFTALSLAIFLLESLLPPLLPLPGIKLGLANIVTLILLRRFSLRDTFLVVLARILLSSFFYSQAISLLYSLLGGLLSLLIMYLLNRLLKAHFLYLTSIFDGISHNLGQIIAACLSTSSLLSFILPSLPPFKRHPHRPLHRSLRPLCPKIHPPFFLSFQIHLSISHIFRFSVGKKKISSDK